MGNFVVSALKVVNCDTCAKDVCNACKINSNCRGTRFSWLKLDEVARTLINSVVVSLHVLRL